MTMQVWKQKLQLYVMLSVRRRRESEAVGFFNYFITGGSEVKEELLSVKPEMQALTVECC